MVIPVQEILELLQPLSKDRFVMLVGNWYRLNRGKFKVPIFAHQELDLHRVFWEVQARGGSDMVTAEKMWKVSGKATQPGCKSCRRSTAISNICIIRLAFAQTVSRRQLHPPGREASC